MPTPSTGGWSDFHSKCCLGMGIGWSTHKNGDDWGAVYDFLTGAKRREWMGMGEWDDYY